MIRRLGDIASFRRGLTYSKGDEVPMSSKCVLRSNNIDLDSSTLDFSELKYLRDDFVLPEEKKLRANSILICMSNGSKQHVGKVAFIDADMELAFGGFMGLIVPSGEVSAKYVFYACKSSLYRTFLSKVGNGIGITNLRFSDLEKFELPVPSLSEQERIVAELDLLSGIVEKKKAQIRTLDSLAQSIFHEMFGDLIYNDFKWESGKLGDLCVDKSYIQRATKYYSCSDHINYIDISSIDSESHEVSSVKDYEFALAPSRAQQVVIEGDVLISLVRPNLRNIAIVQFGQTNLVASSGFCVLRPKYSVSPFIK